MGNTDAGIFGCRLPPCLPSIAMRPDNLTLTRIYAQLPEGDLRDQLRDAVKAGEDRLVGILVRQAVRQLESEEAEAPVDLPPSRQAREGATATEPKQAEGNQLSPEFLIETCEGWSPEEVAAHTLGAVSARRIEQVRTEHDRWPKNGLPKPEFLTWPEYKRRRVVRENHAAGYSILRLADELGVSRTVIRRYLPAENPPDQ